MRLRRRTKSEPAIKISEPRAGRWSRSRRRSDRRHQAGGSRDHSRTIVGVKVRGEAVRRALAWPAFPPAFAVTPTPPRLVNQPLMSIP